MRFTSIAIVMSSAGRCSSSVVYVFSRPVCPYPIRGDSFEALHPEAVVVSVDLEHRARGAAVEERVLRHVIVVQRVAPARQVGRRRGHRAGCPEDRGPGRRERAARIVRLEHAGRAEVERIEEPSLDLLLEGRPGQALDDHPEQVVVRVRVRPALPRLVPRRVEARQQPARGPCPFRMLFQPASCRVVEDVRQAAGVVEELADRDLAADLAHVGQESPHGVVEAQPPLVDELEDRWRPRTSS